jgi:hypothetical protein
MDGGRIEIAPPSAPVVEVCVPIRAPEAAGGHDLVFTLGAAGQAPAPPAWRKAILVRPLHGASYQCAVPARLSPGVATVLPVYVTNKGMLAWEGGDFRLSYHWRAPDGRSVIRDGWRTYLPHAVASGEGVSLRARLEAPKEAGHYVLEWDMVVEDVAWFSELGVPASAHPVEIGPEETPATP